MRHHLFLIILTLCFSEGVFGQYNNVEKPTLPETLKEKFQNEHPEAKNVEWEWEDNHYEVEFTNKWTKREEIWYSSTDVVIRQKIEINKKDLPETIKATIKKSYPEYRIDDPRKIIEKNQQVIYKVELESFTQEWLVWFDEKGNVTNRIAD